MKRYNIALTIRSFGLNNEDIETQFPQINVSYRNTSGERLTEKELAEAIRDADGVIAGTEPFTRTILQSASRLHVLSRVGVGTDSIDLISAKDAGILVVTTPVAPVQAVAEHTLALLFCSLRHIHQYNQSIHERKKFDQSGYLLNGKKVGIIGMGRIGYRVGTLVSVLGCSVTYYDPYNPKPVSESWTKVSTIEELLTKADIITLHTPAQGNNRPLLTESLLARCRPNSIIINTARGSLIDENGLIKALDTGIVCAAGLDVLPQEPYSGRLLNYPQVVLTPHIASNTSESRSQMEKEALDNLVSAMEKIP